MLRRMWCHHFHRILIPLCLKQIHLCMILHVLIIPLQICWGDLFSVHSLPLFITYNYILLQCNKVWLMLKRMWCHYFHRILIPLCLKQIHLCMILHVINGAVDCSSVNTTTYPFLGVHHVFTYQHFIGAVGDFWVTNIENFGCYNVLLYH